MTPVVVVVAGSSGGQGQGQARDTRSDSPLLATTITTRTVVLTLHYSGDLGSPKQLNIVPVTASRFHVHPIGDYLGKT